VDAGFLDRFREQVNEDLNLPRAMAVVWDLVKSDLPAAQKKATLLVFDQVLGLGLENWHPQEEVVPAEIEALLQQRQQARAEKRWKDADGLRDQITAAGFEIEDTPQGPRVKRKKNV
jgi:cysteinyl-tRNA synthetase